MALGGNRASQIISCFAESLEVSANVLARPPALRKLYRYGADFLVFAANTASRLPLNSSVDNENISTRLFRGITSESDSPASTWLAFLANLLSFLDLSENLLLLSEKGFW